MLGRGITLNPSDGAFFHLRTSTGVQVDETAKIRPVVRGGGGAWPHRLGDWLRLGDSAEPGGEREVGGGREALRRTAAEIPGVEGEGRVCLAQTRRSEEKRRQLVVTVTVRRPGPADLIAE